MVALFTLAGVTLLLRFPFFRDSVIDWDESTLALVGQSLLTGHLPFTQLIDTKGPVTFVFYALGLVGFSREVIGLRIMASLLVWFTGVCIFAITNTLWNRRAAWLAALIWISGASLTKSTQSLMSEHIAMTLVMLSLYLLITGPFLPTRRFFLAGLMAGGAAMTRLNLVLPVLAIGACLVLKFDGNSDRGWLPRGLYIIGLSLPLLLILILYAIAGEIETLYRSMIELSLGYARAIDQETVQLLQAQFFLPLPIEDLPTGRRLLQVVGVGLASATGTVVLAAKARGPAGPTAWQGLLLLWVWLLITEVSILRGGAFFHHYVIQLLAPAAILAGIGIEASFRRLPGRLALPLTIGLCSAIVFSSIDIEAMFSSMHLTNSGTDRGRALARYMKEERLREHDSWLTSHHIAYLLNGSPPLTQLVHPSNLKREYMLKILYGPSCTTKRYVQGILATEPDLIVARENWPDYDSSTNAMIRRYLAKDYKLERMIVDLKLYRRILPSSKPKPQEPIASCG
jgi:hypothetical protein